MGTGLETHSSLHCGFLRFEERRCLSANVVHIAGDGVRHSEEAADLEVIGRMLIVKPSELSRRETRGNTARTESVEDCI